MNNLIRSEFLILFTNNGIDLNDERTREWLRPLARSGQLLSIDSIRRDDGFIADEMDISNFAVINASDLKAVREMMKDCPGLDPRNLRIFEVQCFKNA